MTIVKDWLTGLIELTKNSMNYDKYLVVLHRPFKIQKFVNAGTESKKEKL